MTSLLRKWAGKAGAENKRGFTLIELLVVVAVIALLMGILMPALGAAREQGRRIVCGQNEKSTGVGLIMYGNDYNGRLPQNEVDRWLFDVSYWTTDVVMAGGGFDRHIFYCPSWKQRDNIIFWRYGENLPAGTPEGFERPEPTAIGTRKDYHRILGYYWLIDCKGTDGKGRTGLGQPPMSPPGAPKKEWVRSLVKTKAAPADVELVTDVTASNGPNRDTADFSKAYGGCLDRWGIYDRSNHIKGTKATGGNILFVDGHVQWRAFDQMEHRWRWQAYGNPCFWW